MSKKSIAAIAFVLTALLGACNSSESETDKIKASIIAKYPDVEGHIEKLSTKSITIGSTTGDGSSCTADIKKVDDGYDFDANTISCDMKFTSDDF